MKKILLLLFVIVGLVACTNNSVTSRVVSDVKEYTQCTTQKAFHKWLFDIGSEGTTIVDDGVTYGIYRTYDPQTSKVGLMIEIKDGVADYHKVEVLDKLERKVKDALQNQGMVQSVYTASYGCVLVSLKNESGFNNVD